MSEVREQVREHYREVAIDVRDGGDGCCDSGCCGGPTNSEVWGAELYEAAERAELPDAAVLASLGCGNPTAVAELREGETVLDLGSGGGIDVLLSARRVGPTGQRVRPRHDRRDARPRSAERRRGGRRERRVPQGLHRGRPAARRERRRDHLELRDQPVRRQDQGVRRDAARAPTGRSHRDQRRRRVGRPHRPPSGPSAGASSGASPARSRSASTARGSRVPGSMRVEIEPTHEVADGMTLGDRPSAAAQRTDERSHASTPRGPVRLRAQRRAEPDGGRAARASRRRPGPGSVRGDRAVRPRSIRTWSRRWPNAGSTSRRHDPGVSATRTSATPTS